MKRNLVEVLIAEVGSEIKLLVASGKKYCFTAVRDNVMRLHSREIGLDWNAYKTALSSHFGKLGAKSSCKSRKQRKALREAQIREAIAIELSEVAKLGGIHYDEETDCIFGLGEFELDEAI